MFPRIVFFFFFLVISISFGLETEGANSLPSETECRPYIEKALQRESGTQDTVAESSEETQDDVGEPTQAESGESEATKISEEPVKSTDELDTEKGDSGETNVTHETTNGEDKTSSEVADSQVSQETEAVESGEAGAVSVEVEAEGSVEVTSTEYSNVEHESEETLDKVLETSDTAPGDSVENVASESKEEEENVSEVNSAEEDSTEDKSKEDKGVEDKETVEKEDKSNEESKERASDDATSKEETPDPPSVESEETGSEPKDERGTTAPASAESNENVTTAEGSVESHESTEQASEEESKDQTSDEINREESPEEELTMEAEIPKNLRSREHMAQILRLDSETEEKENLLGKTIDTTLKELKKLYDAAIKPLEILYKYRDLSNRHFGDPEIFSKPLILFMGPWSGGKSTIINYLLENEYKKTALRTGAEPSPAYFNIVMWGEKEEVLDGTQLAADWTFSGLQKFGQGLLDRLRGLKMSHPLLQKVNIVEIPGILEIRKQVERLFPFNDACQWFIDRADIIFLVYDPSKLDVGPETEAILDQLKGREMQTKIILNKADQVRPEELMRVQGTLIWNISPLMSSTEPPVMYSTSLWSLPYEAGAPTRLLQAQEAAFLKDLRDAIDRRVENKIASARRFAVRVRNHAKMVDCYLTTYYNHKTFFGNKKKVSDDIIEHPQNYHIYEGLSTLTNISRYDLPDPDVYRDFFRLNPVYEFQQLSATCTYFRGCPINRLDVAIAYDLPELIGKYKNSVEEVLTTKTISGTKK